MTVQGARCTPRGAAHHPAGTGWVQGHSQGLHKEAYFSGCDRYTCPLQPATRPIPRPCPMYPPPFQDPSHCTTSGWSLPSASFPCPMPMTSSLDPCLLSPYPCPFFFALSCVPFRLLLIPFPHALLSFSVSVFSISPTPCSLTSYLGTLSLLLIPCIISLVLPATLCNWFLLKEINCFAVLS